MTQITIQPKLIKQIEEIAREQAIAPSKLVEEALRAYLRRTDEEKMKREPANLLGISW